MLKAVSSSTSARRAAAIILENSRDWCNPAHKTSSCARLLLLLIQIDLSSTTTSKATLLPASFHATFQASFVLFLTAFLCLFSVLAKVVVINRFSSWKIFISSFTQRKWQRSFNSWSDLIIQGEKRTPWAPRFGLFIESKSRHLWPLQWNYLLSNEQEIDSVDHEQCPPLIIGVLWMKKKASLGYYCRGCPLQEMPSSRVGTLIY